MKTYLLPARERGLQKFIRLGDYNELADDTKPELVKSAGGAAILLKSQINGGRITGDSDLREQGIVGTFIAIV